MARQITVIQNEIFATIAANENLQGLNSTSKVAIFRLFAYVVAYAIWLHESFLINTPRK